MMWFASLKIGTKFNLIMSFLLIFLFVAAAFLTSQRQKSLILQLAVDNARNFSKVIVETREYMSSVVLDEPEHNYNLVPQVVATQVALRMTKGSSYYVRQVSLRYRNPDNRPDSYEAAQLESFRKKPGESSRLLNVNGREIFRFMLPMYADKSCLECHGAYEKAPRFVQQRFPRGHYSYNYQIGEVIGAVSVTIPMSDLYREIGANLELDLAVRGLIYLIVIAILGALVRKTIITPVTLLSDTITQVTRTGNFARRLPKSGNDEIGLLINAFNEMMEELQLKTLQSRESEERYRKFIEMAQSAVVTFMEDGRIIISNQKAEELFGLSRQAILGENIFGLLENGEVLRKGILEYQRTGTGGGVGERTLQRVLNVRGEVAKVEMSLTVSVTDHKPLFTAILREIPPQSVA